MKYHKFSLEVAQDDEGKSLALVNIADCYLMLGNNDKSFSYLNQIKENLCNNSIKCSYYNILGKYYIKNV